MGNCCCVVDRSFDSEPLTDSETISLILGRDAPYKVIDRRAMTDRRGTKNRPKGVLTYAVAGTRLVPGALVLYRNRYYNVYASLYGTGDGYTRNGVPQRDFVYLTERMRSNTVFATSANEQYVNCVYPMYIRAVLIDNDNVFIDSSKVTELVF